MKLIPDSWTDFPEALRPSITGPLGRQRAAYADGHLLLLLHRVPQGSQRERRPAIFWRLPNGLWRCQPGTDTLETLHQHLTAFERALEKLDLVVARAKTAHDYFELLGQSRPLARAASNLSTVLDRARDLVPADVDLLQMRERGYELARWASDVATEAETGLSFAAAIQSEEHAVASERMAEETHRLNMLASFFLPLTAVGTVFGMNITHGFETAHAPLAFIVVVSVALSTGILFRQFVKHRGLVADRKAAKQSSVSGAKQK